MRGYFNFDEDEEDYDDEGGSRNGIALPKDWNDWEIIELLGAGQSGVVYKVQKKGSIKGIYSAIKIITISRDKHPYQGSLTSTEEIDNYYRTLVDGFMMEIETLATLRGNSHIVSIEDYALEGTASPLCKWNIYIRMEYLQKLMNYVHSEKGGEGKWGETDAIQLGIDLCMALEACLKKKILHRDIKPDNIFVSSLGEYKLGDFSEAKRYESDMMTMEAHGTPKYIAPEVNDKASYGHQADIYSLGLVLYERMNNDMVPFLNELMGPRSLYNEGMSAEAFNKRMSGEPLPKPCNASDGFSEVILKACAFKASDRYKNATEFREALERLKEGRPWEGHKGEAPSWDETMSVDMGPGPSGNGKRPASNRKKPAGGTVKTVAALAVVAAGAFFLSQGINQTNRENKPDTQTETAQETPAITQAVTTGLSQEAEGALTPETEEEVQSPAPEGALSPVPDTALAQATQETEAQAKTEAKTQIDTKTETQVEAEKEVFVEKEPETEKLPMESQQDPPYSVTPSPAATEAEMSKTAAPTIIGVNTEVEGTFPAYGEDVLYSFSLDSPAAVTLKWKFGGGGSPSASLPGAEATVKFMDTDKTQASGPFLLPAGEQELSFTGGGTPAGTGYTFSLKAEYFDLLGTESGNTRMNAEEILWEKSLVGALSSTEDKDYYRIDFPAGSSGEIELGSISGGGFTASIEREDGGSPAGPWEITPESGVFTSGKIGSQQGASLYLKIEKADGKLPAIYMIKVSG